MFLYKYLDKFKVFLIFFILIIPALAVNENDWWKSLYQEGLSLIEQGQLNNAESLFKQIIKKDKKVPEAHYGLGLVYERRDPGCRKARASFKKAIKYNPHYAEAYYQLGKSLLNLNKKDPNLKHSLEARKSFESALQKKPELFDVRLDLAILEESMSQPSSRAVEILFEGVKFHPDNIMLYRRFIEFLFYHSQEKEAIKMVNQLITNYPDRLIYPLDMAHIFYSLGQFQSGLQLLDIIEQKDDYYSKCKEALIRAKIMFEMEKDTLGLKYYLDALDSIQDTSDVKLVFNDLRYIMRKNEYQEYSTLMINQMTDFYLRFWRSRDPNLATDLNERIPEHYRRLFYARKYFRRYVGEEPYNRWGSRYKLDDADDFAYQISGRKVLDDMGLIHIRHGEPDIVRDYNVGEIETNYSWKYNETSDSPDKIFHFIFRGTYGYNMDPLPITFRNREDLGPVYGRMVFNQYYRETDVPQGDIEQDTERLEEEANEDMQIGFQTETTDYQYKDVALQFPIQFLNFKDKDGLSLFELYYLVIGEDIESESIGQESQLNLSQFIGIYDMRWDQMIRKSEEKRIPLPYTRENWREHSIVLLDRFKLSPGQYHCEFQIKDLITNKIGLFKDTLSVKDFSGPELMLSDILLSGPIEESNKDNFFKKGKISYSPAMFRAFERGSEVGLYFEIYNQTFDANGMTHTEITWTLRKADTKKGVSGLMKKLFWRDKGTVKTSYQVTGVDRDETVYFNLEQGEMNSGNYEIVIKVMDLNTRQVSEREVMITIK